ICHTFPDVEIWIDAGYLLIEHYLRKSNIENLRIILSSESLPSIDAFFLTLSMHNYHNFILSLDYKADHLLGLQELLQYKEQWPKDVIILNLNYVGAEQGYQFPLDLNQKELIKNFNIFYGGGIRNISEMKTLKSIGFAGTLISTALHNQSIKNEDIQLLNQ
ncbi:MAG: HisA/HisF-related TIM barrel protein, partial [Gammaproteobacteria bacterium]